MPKGTSPCAFVCRPSLQAGGSRWPTTEEACRLAMNRLSSSHSAPDHLAEEVRDWGSLSFGVSPEPMVEGPASLTGRGRPPHSRSGFPVEAPHLPGHEPLPLFP